MASPIPPDPYEALGVAKDVDNSVIKTAYRKLVLKHHPDRIQDPALKEKGKDAFQKIQQAYELLIDPTRRQRYDDRIKLAELRKEAMMRDGPTRSQTYPMRPAPPPSSTPREYSHDDGAYYETRRPRHTDFDSSKERFEDPLRTSSRKYPEYERGTAAKKSAEKERPEKSAKAAWSKAQNVVNFGIRVKKEAERVRSSKTQEAKDRERRKERMEKENRTRRPYVVSESESDSDTATRVTSSTIKPARPSPRHAPHSSTSRPSTATRRPAYGDEDSDGSDFASRKWESHHDKSKEYIEKAAAGAGKRPTFERHESGSYWTSNLKSGSDSDRRPTSSKGRHSYDEPRARPSMPTQNSAPGNLKTRVEERAPKDRRAPASASYSSRDRDFDHRKDMPSFQRSQTMPSPRTGGRKDAAPGKSSNLKHTETHDSGYGSSSSPHTPDPREGSPARRGAKQSSTRYQIVEPESEEERRTRFFKMQDSDSDHRRRRYLSPDTDRRREKPERPRVSTQGHTRSKSSRDSPVEMPKMRRAESSRYDDKPGRESPRDSPSDRRHNSSREKLYGEVDDFEKEGARHKYGAGEKTNVRSPQSEAQFSTYPDQRNRDYAQGSRFHADVRGSRRPSVQAGVY